MMPHRNSDFARKRRLVTALSTVLGLVSIESCAAVFVTNCNDSGPGSLRTQIGAAAEGATVDLSQLTTSSDGCSQSKITLSSGEIPVQRNSLTIAGSSSNRLKVVPANFHASRIFNHSGTGKLTISDLNIYYGARYPTTTTAAKGGCIYSAGFVELDSVVLSSCSAKSMSSAPASGGAIYARQNVYVNSSAIMYSTVTAYNANALGGGVATPNSVFMQNSTITRNQCLEAGGGGVGKGGGIGVTGGQVMISSSLISNNETSHYGGGLAASGVYPFRLINSTVAGNYSGRSAGGVYAVTSPSFDNVIIIDNSTIAFNSQGLNGTAAGIYLSEMGRPYDLTINSTLISNNFIDATPSTAAIASDADFSVSKFSGEKNLVFAPVGAVPDDTIVGKCPMLGSLRNNGGPTATIAPQNKSLAIDAGNNVLSLSTDQRLAGFARDSGSSPDIGAYEVQKNDIVFDANFEGCL
jgi:hypothetical protein